MSAEFEKYVSDIFQSLEIEAPFEVYEFGSEVQPLLRKLIGSSREYLVCCEESQSARKIEKFIGKRVYTSNKVLYWFDGKEIEEMEKSYEEETHAPSLPQIATLTAVQTVSLPQWLDDFIFQSIGALYKPSGAAREFDSNLYSTRDRLLIYLGTYFPRSFAESYSIFSNLFSNPVVAKELAQKQTMDVCSIGTGTGGDMLGLLTAISCNFKTVREVNITSIEGNSEALEIAESIIDESRRHYEFDVRMMPLNHTFSNLQVTRKFFSHINPPFDFILTSKMLNELVSDRKKGCEDSYFDFAKGFLPCLKTNGLCLILDITSKADNLDEFYPKLLNEQINRALREMDSFKTLLPLPCNLFEQKCGKKCFTQKTFYVSHSRQTEDESRVCYRVLGRKGFIDQIGHISLDNTYSVTDNGDRCGLSSFSHNESIIDGFLLIPEAVEVSGFCCHTAKRKGDDK
jgi:hypothetical protein